MDAPLPPTETERLAALQSLGILDTPNEERFDRVTRLLANLLDAPIALVSLVDRDRQWFKSCVGLDIVETPRDQAFCAHAILGSETFVVPDATQDERFRDNPLVTSAPNIRFYAGHPLQSPDGHHVGTLCVIDRKSRSLTPAQQQVLRDLAAIVERELTLTEVTALQRSVIRSQQEIERLLHCILPASIAAELRDGPRMIARSYPEATIFFMDLEGFSSLAATLDPDILVQWLNSLFSQCDQLAQWYGLEKIKTIGDAYMAVAGVPDPRPGHVFAAADMALRIQRELLKMSRPDGGPMRVRVGIHTGPVVGGVIGASKFAFDLWGPTVNIAAELEHTATPGTIHISKNVRDALGASYECEPAATLKLKGGRGELDTFILQRRVKISPLAA